MNGTKKSGRLQQGTLPFSARERNYYIYKIWSFRTQLSLYTGRPERICAKFSLRSIHMCLKNIVTYFGFIVKSSSKS